MKKLPTKKFAKYPFLNRFLTGLVVALAFALTAFEWTTITTEPNFDFPIEYRDNTEEILPPITYQLDKAKKVQQEKLSNQMTVVEILTKPDPTPKDDPEPIAQDVEPLAPIDPNYFGKDDFDKVDYNVPFTKVQVFAHYKKCKGLSDEELKECSQLDLKSRIFKNFKTTPQLRAIGAKQGALMSFVVDKQGNITEIKAEQSTSNAMEKAATKAIEKLPKLDFPANQQGRTVSLRMEVPIVLDLK